jgi:hypothetical protein
MPSHAVQSRRRHFRAWKSARSVASVPLALRGGRGGLCHIRPADAESVSDDTYPLLTTDFTPIIRGLSAVNTELWPKARSVPSTPPFWGVLAGDFLI